MAGVKLDEIPKFMGKTGANPIKMALRHSGFFIGT
jgi:hypothetical protein